MSLIKSSVIPGPGREKASSRFNDVQPPSFHLVVAVTRRFLSFQGAVRGLLGRAELIAEHRCECLPRPLPGRLRPKPAVARGRSVQPAGASSSQMSERS